MIGIDSNVIIDILKNNQESLKSLSELPPDELCTSEVVVFEIMCGILSSKNVEQKLKQFKALLDTFVYVFTVDRKSALKSAEVFAKSAAAGKMTEHPDALIAGSLMANGCIKFITRNAKHFDGIKGLEVISY